MSTIELIGVVVGIPASLIGILGFVYTIRTRAIDKKEQRLIEEQRVRQLPDPKLCFYDYSLIYGKTYNIVIGIPTADYEKSYNLISQFPIAVSNTGGSELPDFSIIFKHAPDSPLPISNDGLGIESKDFLIATERHYFSDSESRGVAYKINRLMPGALFVAKELIRIYPTDWKFKRKGISKEGKPVITEISMSAKFFFDVLVSFKDQPIKKVTFNLFAFQCNNLDELEKILIKKLNKDRKEKKEVAPEGVNYFLYYPNFKTLHKDLKCKVVEALFDKMKLRRIKIEKDVIVSERIDRSKNTAVEL